MGLDITAIQRPERCDEEEGYHVWDGGFPGRLEGMEPGPYADDGSESHGFRAGSYSGYNAFRDWLCRAVHGRSAESVWSERERTGSTPSGPFMELIDFTDCDGSIGPLVAAKLARDFADHEAAVLAQATGRNEWFAETYRDFRRAFELAADTGVVIFH